MTIPSRTLAAFVLAACVVALAFAMVAQYVFGLRPCVLCIAQRVPFVVAGLLAAGVLLPSLPAPARRPLLLLAGLVLAVNAGIAFYHSGVEQHWWSFEVCSGSTSGPVSMADMMAQMNKPAEVRCDQPAWSFHGITMAVLNVPFSAALGSITLVLAWRQPSRRR
jgi:disulfide bond formation protein DsbB